LALADLDPGSGMADRSRVGFAVGLDGLSHGAPRRTASTK
jgi:hypothetical protein